MDVLELLHRKVREEGGKVVRDKLQVHSGTLGAWMTGLKPIPPDYLLKITSLWPEENPPVGSIAESDTEGELKTPLSFAILMPVRNTYDPATVFSVISLVKRTGCGFFQLPFDSMVARSRNILAASFLNSKYEWSMWIDDDMVVPTGNVAWFNKMIGQTVDPKFSEISAPYQLTSHNKTIVSGVYFSRHGVVQITAGFPQAFSLKRKLPSLGLIPVVFCGFGCVMVHRKVFEDILAKWPELWPAGAKECQVFSTFQIGDHMAGEDEAFCHRANQVGHATFLDGSVVCGHVGRKVYYAPEGIIP